MPTDPQIAFGDADGDGAEGTELEDSGVGLTSLFLAVQLKEAASTTTVRTAIAEYSRGWRRARRLAALLTQ
jgi:hypothetical protein